MNECLVGGEPDPMKQEHCDDVSVTGDWRCGPCTDSIEDYRARLDKIFRGSRRDGTATH